MQIGAKRFFLLSLVLCCVQMFIVGKNVQAAVVTVASVGTVYMTPGQGGTDSSWVLVELINSTGATIPGTNWTNGAWRAFYVYKPLGDQALALFLTALSNKTKVVVNLGGDASVGSLVFSVAATQISQ